MLTGTETSPKEIVAVPMDRAGMIGEMKEVSGPDASESALHHKYFLRGKLAVPYSYVCHRRTQQLTPPQRTTISVNTARSGLQTGHLSRSAPSSPVPEVFSSCTNTPRGICTSTSAWRWTASS